MKIINLLIALVFILPAANAAELDRAAAALSGTQAQFTQRFTPKGFKSSQTDSGVVVFGTVPMMRWSYAKPEEKVFVFDGYNTIGFSILRRTYIYVTLRSRLIITRFIIETKIINL